MSKQLQFDFRSPEEIARQRKIAEENEKVLNDMFSNDDYVYNKYVDFLLDLIPFRWGWRAKNWPRAIRWWAKCKYQKIRYGVSDDDVYSLGYNIALFALPRLKYFKKKGKGVTGWNRPGRPELRPVVVVNCGRLGLELAHYEPDAQATPFCE